MLEGVLLDMDGVIVDFEFHYYSANRQVFLQHGVNIGTEEYVRRWMIEQTSTRGAIQDYKLSVTEEEIREARDKILIVKIDKELELMPHARDLIDRLQYPKGIVTSSYRHMMERKLGKFNLLEKFQAFVCTGETRGKKYPDPYQRGAELLGYPPGNVLVIEDNPTGVNSAKDAGCAVIAYPNGFTKDMDFSRADTIVADLSEVNDDLIRQLF